MKQGLKNTQLLLFGESTARLNFRELKKSDFNTWLRFCEDKNSLKYIRPAENESPLEKCNFWFEKVFHRYNNDLGGMNVLIDRSSGELVGQCGLLVQTVDDITELEIGYSLMPEHRGKGFALEAAMKCRDFAFGKELSESLISIIHIENRLSESVALRNGMHSEKRTVFNTNPVNIFRILRSEWMNKDGN